MVSKDTSARPPQAMVGHPRGMHAAPPMTLAGWREMFGALAIPTYRTFWIGTLFSFAGMQIGMISQQWLVFSLTGSATMLGVIGAAGALPMLLLSLPGGAVADRVIKRNLLLVTQVGSCLVAFSLATLIFTGLIQPWHVLIAALISSSIFSFNGPGRQALLSELVPTERLMNAIALNSMGMNLTRIVTPTVAGMLVAAVGLAFTYSLHGLMYVAAACMLLLLPRGLAYQQHNTSMIDDLTGSFRYLWEHKLVLSLMVLALAPAIFAMPYQMLLPVFVSRVLERGPETLGLMMGANGAGALGGSLLVAALGNFRYKGWLMLGAALVFSAGIILLGFSHGLVLSAAILVLMGMASMVYMATNNTILQMSAPPEMRGRVMGIYMMTFGLMPLGTLPAGVLADTIGLSAVFALGGSIMGTIVLGMLILVPGIRRAG